MENENRLDDDSVQERNEAENYVKFKNREYQRTSRKRKQEKRKELESRVQALEAEQMELKRVMHIGLGKTKCIKEVKVKLQECLSTGVHKEAFKRELLAYHDQCSEFGQDRKRRIAAHLSACSRLIQPTSVTQQGIVSVLYGHPINADTDVPETLAALIAHLQITPEQRSQLEITAPALLAGMHAIQNCLQHILELQKSIENSQKVVQEKTIAIQDILTPLQTVHFITWVNENPAFMYMLRKLVDQHASTVKL